VLDSILDGGVLLPGKYAMCEKCAFMTGLPSGSLADLRATQPPESDQRVLRYTSNQPYSDALKKQPLENLKVDGLRKAAITFHNNMVRLDNLSRLPAVMAWASRLFQELLIDSSFEATGHHRYNEKNKDDDAAVRSLFAAKWDEYFKSDPKKRAGDIQQGWEMIESLRAAQLWSGLEASLLAQVTGTWTAIETLLGDLWVASLNTHPHTLSALRGKKYKSKRSDDDEGVDDDEPDHDDSLTSKQRAAADAKSIRLNKTKLQKYGFDLSRNMGDALKYRFTFSKLDSARDAYHRAFPDDPEGRHVRDAVCHVSLDALVALRNVIVHCSGMSDDVYRNAIKGLRNAKGEKILDDVPVGFAIPIDGTVVLSVVLPALRTGVEIVHAVDNWIQVHSKRAE
jgi:hypothetical protein